MHRYTPDLYCHNIADVPFASLAKKNIVNICLDVDNTLAKRDYLLIDYQTIKALDNARRKGHIKNICIVSNISWGHSREERVRKIAEQLEIEHYFAARFWERKPGAKPFLEAMRMMNSQPENTAIIGDQIFTDVLGGKRLGLYTILVRPLGEDHWTTRLTGRRRREMHILKHIGFE